MTSTARLFANVVFKISNKDKKVVTLFLGVIMGFKAFLSKGIYCRNGYSNLLVA